MSIASLYPSINPSLLLDFANSKVLDPRITFTRTTTATYYDGVTTAKAEQNLYSYSQTFTTWWTSINASLTANSSTAPDGTNTATLMYPSSTGGETIIYPPSTDSTQAYTVSCYAKASGKSYLMLQATASSLARTAWFNLSTGAVGTVGADISSASITSVGSGWYRCAITFTIVGGIRGNIGLSDSDNSFSVTASGTNGIYIWGAQLEQRSSATAYTATTSQAITNYIPVLQTASAGQARFDHNPTTGESLGLLIEEARTNSQTYSQDFTNAVWNNEASRTIITANTAIAPDGTLTADKFAATTDNNVHRVYNSSLSISAGVATTISWFAKRDGYDVAISDSGNRYSAWFNLSTGTATVTLSTDPIIASMVPVGNGWYRCVATITPANSGNFPIINSYNGGTSFAGNGFSGFFIWGYQFEVGAFATSYIPTVASSVTRNADAASMTGTNFSSWFNNGEGTVYWDRRRTNTSANPEISIYNSTVATAFYNGSIAYMNTPSSGTIKGDSVANGVSQASVTTGTGLTGTGSVKTAYAYKANDFAGSSNGQSAGTDTSGILQTGVDTLAFFTSGLGGFQHLGKFAYYPIRVTNAQLQSLTV